MTHTLLLYASTRLIHFSFYLYTIIISMIKKSRSMTIFIYRAICHKTVNNIIIYYYPSTLLPSIRGQPHICLKSPPNAVSKRRLVSITVYWVVVYATVGKICALVIRPQERIKHEQNKKLIKSRVVEKFVPDTKSHLRPTQRMIKIF